MKKAELIVGAVALTGIILGFCLITEGNIITIPAMGVLALLYFPLGFLTFTNGKLKYTGTDGITKSISAVRVAGAVATGLSLSVLAIGLLFKIMRWPGSGPMLLLGVVSVVPALVASVVKYTATPIVFYRNMIIRVAAFAVPAVLLLIYPYAVLDIRYRNYPEYIKAAKALAADPTNPVLKERERTEQDKVWAREHGGPAEPR